MQHVAFPLISLWLKGLTLTATWMLINISISIYNLMIKEEDLIRFKKEKVKLNYLRRERINELLCIHPIKRQKEEEYELAELLLDYPCFLNVAEENFNQLIEICWYIYMECLLPDSVIIK